MHLFIYIYLLCRWPYVPSSRDLNCTSVALVLAQLASGSVTDATQITRRRAQPTDVRWQHVAHGVPTPMSSLPRVAEGPSISRCCRYADNELLLLVRARGVVPTAHINSHGTSTHNQA